MLRLSAIVASAVFIFSGCWNKDFQEPGRIEVDRKPTESSVNSNFQRVWSAAQASLAKFPLLRKDADTTTGRAYVVTDWIRGKSDMLFHGFDENRIPYIIRYKLFIYIAGESRSNRTKVTIK